MASNAAHYEMSSTKILENNGMVFRAGPGAGFWLNTVLGSGLFLFLGVVLVLSGRDSLLIGLVSFGLALFFLSRYPLKYQLSFDYITRQVLFTADYLIHFPRQVEMSVPFMEIVQVSQRQNRMARTRIVDITMLSGSRISLDFGRRAEDAEQLVNQWLTRVKRETPALLRVEGQLVENPAVEPGAAAAEQIGTLATMNKELRSWGFGLLLMGAMQMVAAQGISPWGTLLIIVGLASFYFREAPMFIVYGVTIALAGIMNLLDGSAVYWKIFALLQGYWAFGLFRQYRRFHQAEQAAGSLPGMNLTSGRMAKIFPWLAVIGGVLSFGGFLLSLLGIFGSVLFFQDETLMKIFSMLETITVYMGIIALSAGITAWAAKFPRRWAAVIGTIGGVLPLVVEIAIGLLVK